MSEPARQTVTVPEGENRIVVRARGHATLRLLREGATVAEERAGGERTSFVVEPGEYELETDGTIDAVEVDAVDVRHPFARGGAPLALDLASDAPDRHVVDGVGELAADGGSCTIIVRGLAGGEPARATVHLRTTGGSLEDERGGRLRSVELRDGAATCRLVADAPPRLVTVTALAEGAASATLPIEFV